MSDERILINFDCPHCGKPQNKKIFKGAEIETICDQCNKAIGIITDENGKPMRIGTLTTVEKLLKTVNEGKIQHEKVRSDVHDDSSISISNVYGNISVIGGVNTTTIYNDTIKLINEARGIRDEQKSQAKEILEYVKNNGTLFLPIVAEAIKKALGL